MSVDYAFAELARRERVYFVNKGKPFFTCEICGRKTSKPKILHRYVIGTNPRRVKKVYCCHRHTSEREERSCEGIVWVPFSQLPCSNTLLIPLSDWYRKHWKITYQAAKILEKEEVYPEELLGFTLNDLFHLPEMNGKAYGVMDRLEVVKSLYKKA